MNDEKLVEQTEEEQMIRERYALSVERIRAIAMEETTKEPFRAYFKTVATFILQIDAVREQRSKKAFYELTLEELQKTNLELYKDILPENYGTSYANPAYAVEKLGGSLGPVLSVLYTEIRSQIPYVFEQKLHYLAILNELFIEVYNCFEETIEVEYKEIKNIIYWYASDYCDVFVADRIEEQIDPSHSFAADIVRESDFRDLRYLYQYGEYVTETQLETARHLNSLSQDQIQLMADVYTEGYRIGFINGGKDLSKKKVVNVRYVLGFERVVKIALRNFEKLGLQPTIYRAAVSVLTKRQQHKLGYFGAIANKQYDYDHRDDQGIFLDKRFIERKLDVMKNVYEKYKELAAQFGGPALIDVFGDTPFGPVRKAEAIKLTEKQEQLSLQYDSRSSQMTNLYIKGEERSFTCVAYPIPEIGPQFEEIFNEVIRINTLDAGLYERVQQTIIDALDQGEYVHILGSRDNKTDLKVYLHPLQDPEKETIFENCVADVNIPVGEVFTSPQLKGTDGILHVSKVYLNELQYLNLEIHFKDGMITDYNCGNFESEEENKKFVSDNILHNHGTLPMGEFAIGTNTTAYVVAKKYGIEDKLPVLIAEKMGPHFAVGDTCYSWSEDNAVYNQNGKEIIARDNTVSILRKEDIAKAYFHCHTDVTIPYEELERITVYTKNGDQINIIDQGRFALPGTEVLNEPLDESE